MKIRYIQFLLPNQETIMVFPYQLKRFPFLDSLYRASTEEIFSIQLPNWMKDVNKDFLMKVLLKNLENFKIEDYILSIKMISFLGDFNEVERVLRKISYGNPFAFSLDAFYSLRCLLFGKPHAKNLEHLEKLWWQLGYERPEIIEVKEDDSLLKLSKTDLRCLFLFSDFPVIDPEKWVNEHLSIEPLYHILCGKITRLQFDDHYLVFVRGKRHGVMSLGETEYFYYQGCLIEITEIVPKEQLNNRYQALSQLHSEILAEYSPGRYEEVEEVYFSLVKLHFSYLIHDVFDFDVYMLSFPPSPLPKITEEFRLTKKSKMREIEENSGIKFPILSYLKRKNVSLLPNMPSQDESDQSSM